MPNPRTPAVFNHPISCRKVIAALGQRLRAAWSVAIAIWKSSRRHVLDDALAVVGPPVNAEREVIMIRECMGMRQNTAATCHFTRAGRGEAGAFTPISLGVGDL